MKKKEKKKKKKKTNSVQRINFVVMTRMLFFLSREFIGQLNNL